MKIVKIIIGLLLLLGIYMSHKYNKDIETGKTTPGTTFYRADWVLILLGLGLIIYTILDL